MFVRMIFNKKSFLGFGMILFLNLFATESLAKKHYTISMPKPSTIKVRCLETIKIGDKITGKISEKLNILPPNQIDEIIFKDCNVYHGRYEKMKNQFGGNVKIIVESDHTWDCRYETSCFMTFGHFFGNNLHSRTYPYGYKW